MSDLVNGIKHIGPAYPVKPVQPTQKDREPGHRRRQKEVPEKHVDDEGDDTQPHIDEHV